MPSPRVPPPADHGNESASSAAADVAILVRVWDLPVRAFHWSIVALLIALVVTVNVPGMMDWHMRCGYAVLTLVLFRIGWGFGGSHFARFANFVRGPRAAIAYARQLLAAPHSPYAGHNPLGGWMIVILLALLLVQASTGLFANDDSTAEGPLTPLVSKELSDTISTFHRASAWVLLGLAGVHVGAVLFYLVRLKQDLVRPMLTGTKWLPPDEAPPQTGPSSARALVLLAACIALVRWVVTRGG